MFEVGVVAQFEAAHRLIGDFGPATRLHGHTYRVEVTVQGARLNDDGTLLDIGVLRAAVESEVAKLHYRNLDELDGFEERNTTAEIVAMYLHERISLSLVLASELEMTVRVWESPTVFAGYRPDR